jgi:DNA primase
MQDSEELKKLVEICHSNLKNSKQCLQYLKKERGLKDSDIEKYQLGYFPQSVNTLLKHVSPQTLNACNIVDVLGFSRFKDYYYLVFPIFSEHGDVVGISGRSMIDDSERKILGLAKYQNSSYRKANILYGLNFSYSHILEKRNVFVVEGYFDYISMDKNGIKNTVAICGTAFSRNHLVKLSRYTDRITFILDSDSAGQQSMASIYKKFSGLDVSLGFYSLEDGSKDVDEYFLKEGKSAKTLKQDLAKMLVGWC